MITLIQNFSEGSAVTTADFTQAGMGELTPVPAQEPQSIIGTEVFYESNLNVHAASAVWKDWQATPYGDATITNLNPELASLDSEGKVTRIADGIGNVDFELGGVKTRRPYNVTQTGGVIYKSLGGYVEDTVAKELFDSVTVHADSDPSKRQTAYFSTVNHSGSGTYVRNTNCWARNIDLSCLSVATGTAPSWVHNRPGVLITPRHIRCAHHYCPNFVRRDGYNEFLRFVTPAGVVREVQVIGASSVVSPDLIVLTLSEDVVGCSPAKVGADWMIQPVDGDGYGCYAGGMLIVTDKFRNVGVCAFGNPVGISAYVSPVGAPVPPRHNGQPLPGPSLLMIYSSYYEPPFVPYQDIALGIGGGSSGSPWFALAGNQLIVMAQALTANSGLLSFVKTANGTGNILNTLIAEADAEAGISTGYTVTVATDPTL